MTLDFKKLILNGIEKQMRVQHVEGFRAQIFKNDELPEAVVAKIQQVFGESYLDDANYTLWFSGSGLTKDAVQGPIFKICNSALANSANNMNESDIKRISLGSGAAASPEPAGDVDQVDSLTDAAADDANGEAISGLFGGEDEDSGDDEDDGLDDEINREIDKELDGDEEADDIEAQLDNDSGAESGSEGSEGSEDSEGSEGSEGSEDSEGSEEGDDDFEGSEEGDSDEDSEGDESSEEGGGDSDEDSDEDSDDDSDKDSDEEDLDESVEEPQPGEQFAFLKITMK